MTLTLPDPILTQLRLIAAQGAPLERCGFLMGQFAVAQACHEIRNCSPTPEQAFAMDPRQAGRIIDCYGDRIVGTYHTHPNGTAHPSRADLVMLSGSPVPMVIVAARSGEIRVLARTERGPQEIGVFVQDLTRAAFLSTR